MSKYSVANAPQMSLFSILKWTISAIQQPYQSQSQTWSTLENWALESARMAGAIFNHQIWLNPTRFQQGHLGSYELCSYVSSRGLYWEIPSIACSAVSIGTVLYQISFKIHHRCQRSSKKWIRVVMAIFCQRCSKRRGVERRGGGGRRWAIIVIHSCVALKQSRESKCELHTTNNHFRSLQGGWRPSSTFLWWKIGLLEDLSKILYRLLYQNNEPPQRHRGHRLTKQYQTTVS